MLIKLQNWVVKYIGTQIHKNPELNLRAYWTDSQSWFTELIHDRLGADSRWIRFNRDNIQHERWLGDNSQTKTRWQQSNSDWVTTVKQWLGDNSQWLGDNSQTVTRWQQSNSDSVTTVKQWLGDNSQTVTRWQQSVAHWVAFSIVKDKCQPYVARLEKGLRRCQLKVPQQEI